MIEQQDGLVHRADQGSVANGHSSNTVVINGNRNIKNTSDMTIFSSSGVGYTSK